MRTILNTGPRTVIPAGYFDDSAATDFGAMLHRRLCFGIVSDMAIFR
jgi:hypothetical protein